MIGDKATKFVEGKRRLPPIRNITRGRELSPGVEHQHPNDQPGASGRVGPARMKPGLARRQPMTGCDVLTSPDRRPKFLTIRATPSFCGEISVAIERIFWRRGYERLAIPILKTTSRCSTKAPEIANPADRSRQSACRSRMGWPIRSPATRVPSEFERIASDGHA